jgi:hypothetical protein
LRISIWLSVLYAVIRVFHSSTFWLNATHFLWDTPLGGVSLSVIETGSD